jgi:hypothetical protein
VQGGEIELLHEKIDQLREREVLKLTEAVGMLTELLQQSASDARESMRTTNGHHNARLLTSWHHAISDSPREISCLHGRAHPAHNQEATNVSPEAVSNAASRWREGDHERRLEHRD